MFKKKDLILIGVMLILCVISYVAIQFFVKKDGSRVLVKVDGMVKYEHQLNQDTELTVQGYQGGENHIVIHDGKVSMTDADCPDKLCVNMGKISKTGETIVCLPHRVVVEITGAGDGVDSVVQQGEQQDEQQNEERKEE